jgi:hypothetical protein
MSHWAEINSQNQVIRVLVGDNNEADEGYQIILDAFGGTWIKTSYNGKIRKNYAGIGYTYDESRDAFIAPKCHEIAVLDETTCRWTCTDPSHEMVIFNA